MRLHLPLLTGLAVALAGSSAAALPGSGPRLPVEARLRLLETAPAPAASFRLAPELSRRLAEATRDLAHTLDRDALPGLDEGGGASDDQLFGFILGFIPGFGLGHLIQDDGDGFVFYLIVDFAVVGAGVLLTALLGMTSLAWAVLVLGWVGIHLMQGLDAYRRAGGGGRRRAEAWAAPPDERLARRGADHGVLVQAGGGHVLAVAF